MTTPPTAPHPVPAASLHTVVGNGYCIGCGACAAVPDSPVTIRFDAYGRLGARLPAGGLSPAMEAATLAVCPFSGVGANEDDIAAARFGAQGVHDGRIGHHLAAYAGHVVRPPFRAAASSGGVGTWLATVLLENGLVDGVIHVHPHAPDAADGRLFRYHVARTPEEVLQGAKSRYYPVEMSEVLREVRERPGAYALVALPCFLKAAHRLMGRDAVLAERIRYCIGVVCGHLKSTAFLDMLAWQCGVEPGTATSFDFRRKIPGQAANSYGIEVEGREGGRTVRRTRPMAGLYGRDWGFGYFKYKACDYCDDVVAETADISIGDAWLPRYVKDDRGTSVIVVRNAQLHALLDQGMRDGQLHLEPIDADAVAQSQNASLRHRRDGLAYRLFLADSRGEWRPPKRVAARADHLSPAERERFRLRMELAELSHRAFKAARETGRFADFPAAMEPLAFRYQSVLLPRWKQLARWVKRRLLQGLAKAQ